MESVFNTKIICESRINRYIKTACFILLVLLLQACSRNYYEYSTLEIHIPVEINVEEREIRARLAPLKFAAAGGFNLRITVYGFSQGAEIINFSSGDQFSTVRGKSWIKALVQVKKGEEIVQADFIEAAGDNREELLDRFGSMILEITGRPR